MKGKFRPSCVGSDHCLKQKMEGADSTATSEDSGLVGMVLTPSWAVWSFQKVIQEANVVADAYNLGLVGRSRTEISMGYRLSSRPELNGETVTKQSTKWVTMQMAYYIIIILKLICFHVFIYLCVWGGGGQRTFRSWFSLSTMWVPSIKVRLSLRLLPKEPSCRPLRLTFNRWKQKGHG